MQVQSSPPPHLAIPFHPTPTPGRTRRLSGITEDGFRGAMAGGGAHECPQLTEEEQGHYCHLKKSIADCPTASLDICSPFNLKLAKERCREARTA